MNELASPRWFAGLKNRPAWQWALPILALLDLLVYGYILFFPDRVLSRPEQDLFMGIWGLDFIFGELKNGNLPLWNPYILSGTPSFASFQSLTLYPPAWPFMITPLALGVNCFIIFHVFWIGAGMFWWLSRRGLHPFACLVGAALLMFSSPTTLKIYPGHITVLSAMSWAPFVLVAIDALIDEKRKLPWLLLGVFCVAMQIAASFPQHVFYTAGIGGLYFIARLVTAREYSIKQRVQTFAAFCAMYFAGAMLMAVQLLTSWQTSKETARSAALSFKFIGVASFPPENLLTLFAPSLLGNDNELTYWGRWYSWETVFFAGVLGLLLALYGIWGNKSRTRWLFLGAAALMVWLALGKYTPLLRFLYENVPIFGSFRASARALFEAAVFVCGLAALGLHHLLLRASQTTSESAPRGVLKWHSLGTILSGVIFIGVGLWSNGESAFPFWNQMVERVAETREYFLKPSTFSDPRLLELVPAIASRALLLAGMTCAVGGVLFWLSARRRQMAYLLGTAAILEVCLFAFDVMPSFPLESANKPRIEEFLKNHPGDYRFIKADFNNLAMKWRAHDMGGYESFRLRRYDEFAQWSQGKNPDTFSAVIYFEKMKNWYRMLRCRYSFDAQARPQEFENTLPHALLVDNFRVEKDRDAIFRAMTSPNFNPGQQVLLESEPDLLPKTPHGNPFSPGEVRVRVLDTDTLEIEAEANRPSILLITDTYSTGWKATALPGSSQQEYPIQPANYILRAIPVQAGTHRIRLEYLPSAFVIGKWISTVSWLLFGVLTIVAIRRTAFHRSEF